MYRNLGIVKWIRGIGDLEKENGNSKQEDISKCFESSEILD
ncbi:MAG: hypothetical protein ACOH1O_05690 [Flavobacterium sp.]